MISEASNGDTRYSFLLPDADSAVTERLEQLGIQPTGRPAQGGLFEVILPPGSKVDRNAIPVTIHVGQVAILVYYEDGIVHIDPAK